MAVGSRCGVLLLLILASSDGKLPVKSPCSSKPPSSLVNEIVSVLHLQQIFLVLLPGDRDNCSDGNVVLKSLLSSGIQVTVLGSPSLQGSVRASEDQGSLGPSENHNLTIQGDFTNVTGEDAGEISDFEKMLSLTLKKGDGRVGVWVVGDMEGVVDVGIMMNKRALLGPGNILLLQSSTGVFPSTSLAPHLRLGAKVLAVERASRHRGRDAWQVRGARLLQGGSYSFRTVRHWVEGIKENQHPEEDLLPTLSSFKGASIKVVILKDFVEAQRTSPDEERLKGYLADVLHDLTDPMALRYHLLETKSFGNLVSNGSFDGVVGFIERKEGDVGLASLSISYLRHLAVDFSTWMLYSPIVFVTRKPRFMNDPFIIFHIYSWQGWLTIAAFLVFSSLCQWFLWPCVNPDDHSSTSATTTTVLRTTAEAAKNLPGTTRPSFISILSTMLKAIMGQGGAQLPLSNAGRIVFLSSWMVLVVILVVYSGNLTAFLSMPHVDRPPSTIHDIVTMGWTITLNKAYGSHDLVKETQTEDYQILYQRALRRGMVKENQGVQRTYDIDQIRDEDVVYVMGKTGADVITNREMSDERQCTLDYGREAIGEAFSAMAFPKMSLIKPYFDAKLRWMRQMGVIHNYYNNYFGIRCFQSSNRKSEKRAMKLDQLLGVFYVWFAGILIAFIVFIMELCLPLINSYQND